MNQTLPDVKTPAATEAPLYYGILTDLGQAMLADAIASGTPLVLTRMSVGDGGGQPVTPSPEMTALVNEVHRAPLNQLFVDPTAANQIVAEMVMPETVGGFWIRELGLHDEQGQLIAVANTPDSLKPLLEEGAGRSLLTRMILIVSDTSSVELIINPDTVMASKAYVDAKLAEHAASRDHPAAAEGAQGMIPLATQEMVAEGTDHNSAVTPKTANETFAKLQHEHEIDEVLWLQEALDEKSELGHVHTPAEAGAAPAVHGHAIADVSGLQGELDGKAAVDHIHPGTVPKPIALGNTEHLDDLKISNVYYQPISVNTSTDRGYPEAHAGALLVYQAAGVVQEYRVYNSNRIWVRAFYQDNPGWTPWVKQYNTQNKPSADDVGAIPKDSPQLANNVDLNTVKTTGFYVVNQTHPNLPSGASGWGLLMVNFAPDVGMQMYTNYTDGKTWIRNYDPNAAPPGWETWSQLYTSTHKPTATDVRAVEYLSTGGAVSAVPLDRPSISFGVEDGDLTSGADWASINVFLGDSSYQLLFNSGGPTLDFRIRGNDSPAADPASLPSLRVYHEGNLPPSYDGSGSTVDVSFSTLICPSGNEGTLTLNTTYAGSAINAIEVWDSDGSPSYVQGAPSTAIQVGTWKCRMTHNAPGNSSNGVPGERIL